MAKKGYQAIYIYIYEILYLEMKVMRYNSLTIYCYERTKINTKCNQSMERQFDAISHEISFLQSFTLFPQYFNKNEMICTMQGKYKVQIYWSPWMDSPLYIWKIITVEILFPSNHRQFIGQQITDMLQSCQCVGFCF